uniref:C-C motif chemokine n=1 Tax=Anas platyrhynchos platyrhynchos TaxID=8840 RepID=A0A493SX68_ANAPP
MGLDGIHPRVLKELVDGAEKGLEGSEIPHLLLSAGVDNVASDCCLRTSKKNIPSAWVKSYRIQGPETGCLLRAVVFTTKKEKKICSSLTSPAIQKVIRRLEDKQKNPSQKPRRHSRGRASAHGACDSHKFQYWK